MFDYYFIKAINISTQVMPANQGNVDEKNKRVESPPNKKSTEKESKD